jgi:hypothetical protein
MVHCEDDPVPLAKRHNHWPQLHARALLRHYEFAAPEVPAWFGQNSSSGAQAKASSSENVE